MPLPGFLLAFVVRFFTKRFAGFLIGEEKYIESEQKDWDWGDEFKAREFEASIGIERHRCAQLISRIDAFLSGDGTIETEVRHQLLDDIAHARSDQPSSYSSPVVYAQAPLKLRIEQSPMGQTDDSKFVMLGFFSSRELAERIEMEIVRFIGETETQA